MWSSWNIVTIIGYLSYSFIEQYLTFSSEFIVAATFLGYFILHWINSPSTERFFVIFLSLLSIILAFLVINSTLIIVLLLIGMIIAIVQKKVEITKNSKKEFLHDAY